MSISIATIKQTTSYRPACAGENHRSTTSSTEIHAEHATGDGRRITPPRKDELTKPVETNPQLDPETGLDLAIMLLDSIEDFLIDMEEIKLPKELRDQLISLKADITDFLNEWANVVGPDEPPDGVPVACATDMCACGHHGVSHCQAGCAICNCSKFEEA